MNSTKHYKLYVLLLEEDKYYVGITSYDDVQTRIDQHKNKSIFKPSKWVQKYPYKDTLEKVDLGFITKEEAEKIETNKTLELIKIHKLQNVRGGDLNYSGKYLKIGKTYLRDNQYDLLFGVILMCLGFYIIVVLYIKK